MSVKLVVVGLGYVGLPMALRAASRGLSVVGLDTNEARVDALNDGHSHIDDVSAEDLRRGLEQGFRASSDPTEIREAQAVLVCVPTPLSDDGGPDLAAVVSAARTIAANVSRGALVVLESTTYPGTTEEIFAPIVAGEDLKVGSDIFVAFSPERIDPGNEMFTVENTPKVVGGVTAACATRARDLYATFITDVVVAKGAREAEMAKLLENTFRHVNIALMNEMVRFSEELDIDLWDAIACAETKPFGYMAFRPGPGVGGHCIPIDPSYLSHRVKAKLGYAFRMVELAEEINLAAPTYVATRVWRALNEQGVALKGSRVLLVGVTYKPDIADERESPAIPLRRRLQSLGATVEFHDQYVEEWLAPNDAEAPIKCVPDLYEAAARADITVLLQPHKAYDLDQLATSAQLVLDTRGVLPESPRVVRL